MLIRNKIILEYQNKAMLVISLILRFNKGSMISDTLPPQCQKVFRMSREEGLKYHEIADELGISKDS